MSTALMYSLAQREDMRVLDEPLYAHFLRTLGQNGHAVKPRWPGALRSE